MTNVFVACSSGGGDSSADGASAGTPPPSSAEPAGTACVAEPIGSSGYSLVFKGCNASNVAEYYDKTECVRDNATGLIWQGQTPAGSGLRANDRYMFYSNYDNGATTQFYDSTVAGEYRAPTWAEMNTVSNSIGFKNEINASNLCGYTNWRIPSIDELATLIKLSETPKIDNAWFPNTPATSWYWSSTPFPDSLGLDSSAYGVAFNSGSVSYGMRRGVGSVGNNLIRLVR
ncbi:MAG TPA: DUF1566 domain-containing protein [Burkholderiaceae bacterium]|nr:DUF1566 domain-containing protein [Burkholderiaceae bacterium]